MLARERRISPGQQGEIFRSRTRITEPDTLGPGNPLF